MKIGFSPLLVCMMLGTVFCNFSEYSVDIMDRSSKWTAPLYALFFVLSGASDAGNRARFEKKEKISGMRVKKA